MQPNRQDPNSFCRKPTYRLPSVSTKITADLWSPDHTSRAPSPKYISYVSSHSPSPNRNTSKPSPTHSIIGTPDPLLYTLEVNKEKLANLYKYYNQMLQQLQINLNISANRLQVHRNRLLADIEYKFQSGLRDLNKLCREKSGIIGRIIKEISDCIDKNQEFIDRIGEGRTVEDFEINHLLEFKDFKDKIDKDWMKIPEKQIILNEKTEVSSQSPKDTEDHEDSIDIYDKNKVLSTLCIKDDTYKQPKGKSLLELYVPFGFPPYSSFYLLKLPENMKIETLMTIIKQNTSISADIKILIKRSPKDGMIDLEKTHTIPQFSIDGWPKLYLKLSN